MRASFPPKLRPLLVAFPNKLRPLLVAVPNKLRPLLVSFPNKLRPLLVAVILLIILVVIQGNVLLSPTKESPVLFVIYSRPSDFWWREVARQTWLKQLACAPRIRGREPGACYYSFVIERPDNIQLSGLERATLTHENEQYGDVSLGAYLEGSLYEPPQEAQSGLTESMRWVSAVPLTMPLVLVSMPVKVWPIVRNLQELLRNLPPSSVLYSPTGPSLRPVHTMVGSENIFVFGPSATGRFHTNIVSSSRGRPNVDGRLDARNMPMMATDFGVEHIIDLDENALQVPCQSLGQTIGRKTHDPVLDQQSIPLKYSGDPIFLAHCSLQQLPVLAALAPTTLYSAYKSELSWIEHTNIAKVQHRQALKTMLSRANLSLTLFDIALGDMDRRRIKHGMKPHTMKNSQWWNDHKATKKDKRVFLIGNAPSLNHLPLWMLDGEDALVFNRFYLMQERFYSWTPSHYMCIDSWVCPDVSPDINWYRQYVGDAFFPYLKNPNYYYWTDIIPGGNTHWFWFAGKHKLDKPVDDRPEAKWQPMVGTMGTVASAGIEVLGFLGYSEIYIIGVDMNYKNFSEEKRKEQGIEWISAEDDKDHFDNRYFGKGRKLKAPDVANVMLPSLLKSVDYINEAYGSQSQVHNAGYMGALEAFERVQFESLFDGVPEAELKRRFLGQLNPTYTMQIDFDGKSLMEMFPNVTVAATVSDLKVLDYAIMEAGDAADNMSTLLVDFTPHGPYEGYMLFVRRPEMPNYVDMVLPDEDS